MHTQVKASKIDGLKKWLAVAIDPQDIGHLRHRIPGVFSYNF